MSAPARTRWLKKMANGTLNGHAKVATPVSPQQPAAFPPAPPAAPPPPVPTLTWLNGTYDNQAPPNYPATRTQVFFDPRPWLPWPPTNPQVWSYVGTISTDQYVTAFALPAGVYDVIYFGASFEERFGATSGTENRVIELEFTRQSDNSLLYHWSSSAVLPRTFSSVPPVNGSSLDGSVHPIPVGDGGVNSSNASATGLPTITVYDDFVVRSYVTFTTTTAPIATLVGAFYIQGLV